MASFKAICPVLQELFAKITGGPLPPPPPPSGTRVNIAVMCDRVFHRNKTWKMELVRGNFVFAHYDNHSLLNNAQYETFRFNQRPHSQSPNVRNNKDNICRFVITTVSSFYSQHIWFI